MKNSLLNFNTLGIVVTFLFIFSNIIAENKTLHYSPGNTTNTESLPNQPLTVPCPTADFSYNYISCDPIQFTDQSTVSPGAYLVSWYWDFGDGNIDPLQNPTHRYINTGTYTVMLAVAADSLGFICRDTTYQTVTVNGLTPDISFTWNPEPTPLGNATSFFGTSSSNISSWYWNFGDGATSILNNPTYTYTSIGSFAVTLHIADIYGCQNSITHQVTITNVPPLDFSWSTACLNEPVQFTILDPPTNIPEVASWYWSFGDGSTSSLQDPTHTYTSIDTFDVSCSITDIYGATNTVTKQLIICPLPVANFTFESIICANNPVQFTDLSTSPNGDIIEWHWDFGDGIDTTITIGGNPNVTHIYSNTASYTVTLTVNDTTGCSHYCTKPLSTLTSPLAGFTYTYDCFNQPVSFTDTSSTNGGEDIVSWYWDFGDTLTGSNNTSTLQNPAHTFSSTGDFNVELTVTNNNGCYSTITNLVSITTEPVEYTWEYTCFGDETQFTVDTTITNIANVATWNWNFGDSNTSNLQNPTHTYDTTGAFVVTLSITTITGCTGNISHIVNIYERPDVVIIVPTSDPIIDMPYQFYGHSASQITSWSWDFGDGNTSTLQNPVNTYYEVQTYNVTLNAVNNYNCSNSDYTIVNVIYPPIFPENNAVWNITGENIFTFEPYRKRLALIGDTTIASNKDTSYVYSKIYSLYDSIISMDNAIYTGAVRRTDELKIFLKLPNLPETLLYDFGAELNDTIWYNVSGYIENNNFVFIANDHYNVVTKVDSILLLDDLYHKRIRLVGETIDDTWVEGIGSIDWVGLFNPLITSIASNGDEYTLACYKENDFSLYINNPECDNCFCYLLTDIESTGDECNKLLMYPNPAKDNITIDISGNDLQNRKLLIYNTFGTLVYNTQISGKVNIKTSNWQSGIYYAIIRSKSKATASTRFVIMK